jgi:hypothetical protein
MKTLFCCALGLLISAGPSVSSPARSTPIKGDYVEARTASVFAGACHYNGELVTTGHEAVAAWSFASGTWDGVSLSGVRAAAAVTSDANLGQQAARKTELVVDSSASDAQVKALVSLLRQKCGRSLGEIVTVRRGPVAFTHVADEYRVNADGRCPTASAVPSRTWSGTRRCRRSNTAGSATRTAPLTPPAPSAMLGSVRERTALSTARSRGSGL